LPPLVLVSALCFTFAGPARATEVFAKREEVDCETCHQNPQGGGPRNLVGLYYDKTGVLRDDRATEAAKAEMEATVSAWLLDIANTPPEVIWRYTPLAELKSTPAPDYTAASDVDLLRRLSLDLRSDLPDLEDIEALKKGEVTLDALVDRYLDSDDFYWTMRLYHRDLVRPRTGIFNKGASLGGIQELELDGGGKAWASVSLRNEVAYGACAPGEQVEVSPYWDRDSSVKVCSMTASERQHVGAAGSIDCATERGQKSQMCGCGPHLAWCYRSDDYELVKASMRQEGARIAEEILRNDLPYTLILTSDWSMWDGRLEHYYARLDGRLGELEDADANRPWERFDRGPAHSGVLSTHMFFNYFYNGRRWAQRTFETFLCHETVPDFDLLDEFPVEVPVSYRSHPTAQADINVNSGRACAACHLQLDGLSRLKDRWDNFGQYYDTGYGGGPVPQSAIFLGEEVDGLDAFGKALAASDVFADCAASQMWEHLTGHRFQPEETTLRRELVEGFKSTNHDFRALVRAMVDTEAYRDQDNLKLMERELYQRSLDRLLGVEWDVGKKDGFNRYYDKVGGMDYRRIESRDRSPSTGHSLVQYKAAVEMCTSAVQALDTPLLDGVDPTESPNDDELDAVLAGWYLRTYVRPWERVADADREVARRLFRQVEDRSGSEEAYMATCALLIASQDFALY